jgi:hypothetical protein
VPVVPGGFRVCGLTSRHDQPSEQIADAMTAVTAFGCEIRVRCDPPWNRVMCEWARRAMASSEAAVMIWSPVLMKYQDGIVFQAAYRDGVLNAP